MPPSVVHWTSPEYDDVATKAEGSVCYSVKMKRSIDSGIVKRKKSAEKKKIADTLPKWMSFFTPAAASPEPELATGSVGENVEVEEDGEVAMEAEGEKQVTLDEGDKEDEDDMAVSSARPFTTSSSGNSLLIGDDPAH